MFSAVVMVSMVCHAPAPMRRPTPEHPCYLGIDAREADGGVFVDTIYIAAPASDAGIQGFDRIVSVGEQPIRSVGDLAAVLRRTKPNSTVPVVVQRSGQELRLSVRLAAKRDFPFLGVSLGTTTISDLPPQSPARAAGLREGDVILRVAGRDVSTREQVVGAIRDKHVGDKIEVVVNRDGTEVKAAVVLGARPGY